MIPFRIRAIWMLCFHSTTRSALKKVQSSLGLRVVWSTGDNVCMYACVRVRDVCWRRRRRSRELYTIGGTHMWTKMEIRGSRYPSQSTHFRRLARRRKLGCHTGLDGQRPIIEWCCYYIKRDSNYIHFRFKCIYKRKYILLPKLVWRSKLKCIRLKICV